jgi:hypothetical protein
MALLVMFRKKLDQPFRRHKYNTYQQIKSKKMEKRKEKNTKTMTRLVAIVLLCLFPLGHCFCSVG